MKVHRLLIGARGASALAVLVGAALTGGTAFATDGYFSHGYGIQSKGLAGAGLAYPKETLAIARNPAAALAVGDRLDVGLEFFRPSRSASYSGTALDRSYDGDGRRGSFIPEFGYTRRVGDKLALGVAVYGNGGMLTKYNDNPFARFGATGPAGVDLEQLFVSPTVAYQVAPGHTIGLAVNLAGQRFKGQGVAAFGAFSADPANVSDTGAQLSFGYGVKVGYLGQITPRLSVGAFWQSKTQMGRLKKYAGLFADQGGFDIPSSYGAGVAFKATDRLDLLADVLRINYSEVPSVGNPLGLLFTGHPLGSTGGPGFGWRDVTVYKIGANYRISRAWQVRAGWGYTTKPIPRDQTFLNILAPGVVHQHYTVGATWTAPSGLEVSAYALRAPNKTIRGAGSIPAALGGGEANISLSETAAGVGLGWKY